MPYKSNTYTHNFKLSKMKEVVQIQIAAIFVTFATSFIAFVSMSGLENDDKHRIHTTEGAQTWYLQPYVVTLIKCFTAGVILGVAIMHLFPDGHDELVTFEYPSNLTIHSCFYAIPFCKICNILFFLQSHLFFLQSECLFP